MTAGVMLEVQIGTVRAALACLVCFALLSVVDADFACVCNYVSYVPVYPSKSTSVPSSGSLSYLDCKEFLSHYSDNKWFAIAHLHKIVYVENTPNVLLDICSGVPPNGDAIMAAPAVTVTTQQIHANNNGPKTATTKHTPISTTPSSFIISTTHALTTPRTTTRVTTPSTTTRVTTPSTTTPVTTPSTTRLTTPTTTPSTKRPNPSGDIRKCPTNVISYAKRNNDVIAQFGHKCYIFLTNEPSVAWDHAEHACQNRVQGHLVHIENAYEQQFVTNLVTRYTPYNSIWLGLSDIKWEGTFEWTSAGSNNYFNWDHGRFDTHGGQQADCIILDPRRNGLWNDVLCGSHFFGRDLIHTEKIMCQVRIIGQHLIG